MAAERLRGESGTIEVVIVFPVAILIILLAIQTGMWFLARAAADDAAADGATAAAVLGGTPQAGRIEATNAATQVAGPLLVDPSVTASQSAGRVAVTVVAKTEAILPGLSLSVSATVARPVEEFRP